MINSCEFGKTSSCVFFTYCVSVSVCLPKLYVAVQNVTCSPLILDSLRTLLKGWRTIRDFLNRFNKKWRHKNVLRLLNQFENFATPFTTWIFIYGYLMVFLVQYFENVSFFFYNFHQLHRWTESCMEVFILLIDWLSNESKEVRQKNLGIKLS